MIIVGPFTWKMKSWGFRPKTSTYVLMIVCLRPQDYYPITLLKKHHRNMDVLMKFSSITFWGENQGTRENHNPFCKSDKLLHNMFRIHICKSKSRDKHFLSKTNHSLPNNTFIIVNCYLVLGVIIIIVTMLIIPSRNH